MTLVPFARSSKPGIPAAGYSGERLINYFLRPSDGVSQAVLLGRSGLVPGVNLGGPVRAMADNAGVLYALANWRLWRIVGNIATDVGAVIDDPTASIAVSGSEVACVAAGKYYVYDGGSTQIYATGAVTSPVAVTFQDGYFIVAGSSSGRSDGFTISGLDDGKTFDGLDFAFAESSPDSLTWIISDHGQLYLFGATTTEVFFNSGAAAFPFEPNRSALISRGVLVGRTVAQEDNALFWLGPDNIVYRYAGASPQVISTRELEDELARSTVTAGFVFSDRGHKFYCLRREGETAFCYDISTGGWSERQTSGEWIATATCMVGGVQYVGTSTGAICRFDDLTFTDDGAKFIAEGINVPIVQGGDKFSVSELYLMVGTGDVALPNAPELFPLYDGDGAQVVDGDGVPIQITVMTEPQGRIMMQTSKNGRTWSKERWRGLGKRGNYNKRIAWNGLGDFERFQVRLRISDPVKRDIYGVSYK